MRDWERMTGWVRTLVPGSVKPAQTPWSLADAWTRALSLAKELDAQDVFDRFLDPPNDIWAEQGWHSPWPGVHMLACARRTGMPMPTEHARGALRTNERAPDVHQRGPPWGSGVRLSRRDARRRLLPEARQRLHGSA